MKPKLLDPSQREPLFSEETVYYREGRADQDRHILQRLSPGYPQITEAKAKKNVLKNSISSLDYFVCSVLEFERKGLTGSTLAIVNMYEIKQNGNQESQWVIDGATVGDSFIRLVRKSESKDKSTYQSPVLTHSHNLSNKKFRKENFEREDLCVIGASGEVKPFTGSGMPRLNAPSGLNMGRSIGDPAAKNYYLKFYTPDTKEQKSSATSQDLLKITETKSSKKGFTSEPELTLIHLKPDDQIILGSDGLEWKDARWETNREGNKNYRFYYENVVKKLVRENKLPLKAKDLVSIARDRQIELAHTPVELIDDATAIVATREGDYIYGIFDGHGGKEAAELCQYFYLSIQAAWTLFHYLPKSSLIEKAKKEEERFKIFLQAALKKAAEKMPKQLGRNEVLSFETLFFGYLLEVINDQPRDNQEDFLRDLLEAYNKTIFGEFYIAASDQFQLFFNTLLEHILIGTTDEQQNKPEWLKEILRAYQKIFPGKLDSNYIDYLNNFFNSKFYKDTKSITLDALDQEITRLKEDNSYDHTKVRQLKIAKQTVIKTLVETVGEPFNLQKPEQPKDLGSPSLLETKNSTPASDINPKPASPASQQPQIKSLNKTVKTNVISVLDNLSKDKIICGFRNKVEAFLKGLVGAVMLIVPLTTVLVIWKWNSFFSPSSKNNVNDIKKNYSACLDASDLPVSLIP